MTFKFNAHGRQREKERERASKKKPAKHIKLSEKNLHTEKTFAHEKCLMRAIFVEKGSNIDMNIRHHVLLVEQNKYVIDFG